jgi:hypothetical protein
MEREERKREGERSSLQSKHEGKMLVGSSPGSCTPMQVQLCSIIAAQERYP